MSEIDHSARSHAILSASSADRWLACPPSARMNESLSDESSDFAKEGTKAHELAENCLRQGIHASELPGDYSQEMRDYVQAYLDYVRGIKGLLLIEQRLSFEKWVYQGFGTCDAIVISDGQMSVCDLKYGQGVKVDAYDNSQLKLYALAALDAYDAIYGPIDTVKLVIVQPRLDHIDEWEISASDLLEWADNTVKPIAKLAWEGKGDHKAGEHCRFCKARHTCRVRANENLAIVKSEFGEAPKADHLSNDELAALYPKLSSFITWANDLQAYCLARAETGTAFNGLKLVAGMSRRVINDNNEAIKRLRQSGYSDDAILTTKTKGITDLEKLLGKTKFSEVLGDLVIKPEGKPTLVTLEDKRPALSGKSSAHADFQ